MLTFEQIQYEVGAWSLENFGEQETPHLLVYGPGTFRPSDPRGPGDRPGVRMIGEHLVALGSLAPLMGIGEELGELAAASHYEGAYDAIGDIGIYLMDYCCRESIMFPALAELEMAGRYGQSITGLSAYFGKLLHCHLKRFQRIRGFHDTSKFQEERYKALIGFVWHLFQHAHGPINAELLTVVNNTWEKIVKKRNWKANAAEGAEGRNN